MLCAALFDRVWLVPDVLNLVKQVFGLTPVCCFELFGRRCSCLEQDRARRRCLLQANPIACPLVRGPVLRLRALLVLNKRPRPVLAKDLSRYHSDDSDSAHEGR